MFNDIDLRLHTEIDRILATVKKHRRAIHQHPEIALQEHETARRVRTALEPAGMHLLEPFLETDVVAILEGRAAGPNVTLRADMDALPMQEKTGLAHASQRAGCMHACGHDGHTAMLIGAALVLARLRNEFEGSVRFVFQPGEEVVAAGQELVKQGALRDPEPAAAVALHAWPGIPAGVIAARPGVMLSAADFFTIKIRGQGAHGSRPELSIDPVLTAARVVEALQTIAARNVNALDAVVVSVCRIAGGTGSNIIPDSAELEGTVRYLDPALGQKIPALMERIVKGVCDAMGAECDMEYTRPYIPTVNHSGVVDLGRSVALAVLGPDSWQTLEQPSLGAEDFGYYISDHPGALFRLGMGEQQPPLHNPHFDFNDGALKNGILFMAATALRLLAAPPTKET